MEFRLSEEQSALRNKAKAFVEKECLPLENTWPLSDYDASGHLAVCDQRLAVQYIAHQGFSSDPYPSMVSFTPVRRRMFHKTAWAELITGLPMSFSSAPMHAWAR